MSLLIRPAAWVPFPRNPCGRVAYSLSRRQRGKAALPARRATDRARPRYPALFSSADFVCPCSCLHGPTGAGKLSSRHPRAKPAGLAPRRPGPCAPLREHAADVLQIDQRIAALVEPAMLQSRSYRARWSRVSCPGSGFYELAIFVAMPKV